MFLPRGRSHFFAGLPPLGSRSCVHPGRKFFTDHNPAIASSFARIKNTKVSHREGGAMIERNITLPEMILWTGTRVALGAGIGMLISRRLSKDSMKAAGLALTVVAGFTTFPLAIAIMSKQSLTRSEIRSVA